MGYPYHTNWRNMLVNLEQTDEKLRRVGTDPVYDKSNRLLTDGATTVLKRKARSINFKSCQIYRRIYSYNARNNNNGKTLRLGKIFEIERQKSKNRLTFTR